MKTFWLILMVAGCASHLPAPVVDRMGQTSSVTSPSRPASGLPLPSQSKPGYTTVKKGETLHAIALDHGVDYKDVIAWNNLEDPNRITVGQQLRIKAPEDAPSAVVIKPVTDQGTIESKPLDQTKSDKPVDKPPTKPVEKTAEKQSVVDENSVEWSWPTSMTKVITQFVEGGVGKESNKGIDVDGKLGDAVQAAAMGKVVYAGSGLRGYGQLVIIRHNAAFLSAYAHNSKILVKEGQAVTRGQKIAEVGSSDTDRPKLHFEIRHQGKPVDPLKYLPKN